MMYMHDIWVLSFQVAIFRRERSSFKFEHVRHAHVLFHFMYLACVLFPLVVIVDRQRSRTLFIGQSFTRRAELTK